MLCYRVIFFRFDFFWWWKSKLSNIYFLSLFSYPLFALSSVRKMVSYSYILVYIVILQRDGLLLINLLVSLSIRDVTRKREYSFSSLPFSSFEKCNHALTHELLFYYFITTLLTLSFFTSLLSLSFLIACGWLASSRRNKGKETSQEEAFSARPKQLFYGRQMPVLLPNYYCFFSCYHSCCLRFVCSYVVSTYRRKM